jgi:hypothetical protein
MLSKQLYGKLSSELKKADSCKLFKQWTGLQFTNLKEAKTPS